MLRSDDDCAAWARALAGYERAIESREVTRLADLDRWYRDDLPGLLAARDPAYLTHDELIRVTEWKMKRGVWRARNLALVRGNDPDQVRRISAAALAQIPDPRRPVALLATLAGVGPATASAVVAAACPAVYPFFDEDVADQVPELGPVAFTLPYYLRYVACLRDRAARLATACPAAGWTAHAVAQALWASAACGVRNAE
jgi:hypothetical protein